MHRITVVLALALAWAVSPGLGHAAAPRYSALYSFGDSLSDAGNVYAESGHAQPVSPPYSGGRFSNGQVWVQALAASLGLKPVAASQKGGTDFAYGGATTTGSNTAPGTVPVGLPGQIALFSASVGGRAPGTALYVISIGTNDVRNAARLSTDATFMTTQAQAAAANAAASVRQLIQMGARHILIAGATDLTKTPSGANYTPAQTFAVQTGIFVYNSSLQAQMAATSVPNGKVSVLNVAQLVDQLVAQGAAAGFSNVTDPCWSGDNTNPSSGTLCATTKTAQDQYLYWDALHPTEHGHAAIAAQALLQLP